METWRFCSPGRIRARVQTPDAPSYSHSRGRRQRPCSESRTEGSAAAWIEQASWNHRQGSESDQDLCWAEIPAAAASHSQVNTGLVSTDVGRLKLLYENDDDADEEYKVDLQKGMLNM